MNKVRVSVEIYSDFQKNQKMGLSPIAKQYRVSVLVTNAFTCLYKNNASNYFDLELPVLEGYFANVNV